MKLQKNKLVAILIVVSVLLFITLYSILALGKDKGPELKPNQLPVPKLGEGKKQYETKLEALEDLREEREVNAPSVYDERLLDSTGQYDPELLDKKKRRIIDSIYSRGRIDYGEGNFRQPKVQELYIPRETQESLPPKTEREPPLTPQELGLEHQLFFASNPRENTKQAVGINDPMLLVRVDGTQQVRKDQRLRLRLVGDAVVQGKTIPSNTVLYGFVGLSPNRVQLDITHLDGFPVEYRAHDLGDGNEGIYIENSFRAEAGREVAGDVLDDINIGGVPQLRGIKKLFQRDNRRVKVTVLDNYRLILKVPQGH